MHTALTTWGCDKTARSQRKTPTYKSQTGGEKQHWHNVGNEMAMQKLLKQVLNGQLGGTTSLLMWAMWTPATARSPRHQNSGFIMQDDNTLLARNTNESAQKNKQEYMRGTHSDQTPVHVELTAREQHTFMTQEEVPLLSAAMQDSDQEKYGLQKE